MFIGTKALCRVRSPVFIPNRGMHAVRISAPGGPEALKYVECEKPKVIPGTALVKNKSIGVNYIDVYHRTGLVCFITSHIHRSISGATSVYHRA